MQRGIWASLIVGFLIAPLLGDEKPKKDDKSDELQIKKTGRPGENTLEEEAQIDKIIDRFIDYDLGRNRDRKALEDFNALGAESIPGLIRGFNKSASFSQSCPVVTIGKKLRRLLNETEDARVLRAARENIGAGVTNSPYGSLIRELKVVTIYRGSDLDRLQRAALMEAAAKSKGQKSPGEDKSK